MDDPGNSGIFVMEGPPPGAPIALHRETIAAFIGPAPRGPANLPVAVRSVAEYLRRFGTPDKSSRLAGYLEQFFACGGSVAIVVRICRDSTANRLELPGRGGALALEALCPGQFEYLRASVDYDGLGTDQTDAFNLIVQRLDSARRPLVVEQEIYRGVFADPEHPEYVGHALLQSSLVKVAADSDSVRPSRTVRAGVGSAVGYVYSESEGTGTPHPSDYDLIGSAAEGTGLHALEQVARLDLLCLVSPAADAGIGPVALFAAEQYCRRRHALLLVDPPAHWQTVHDVVSDHQAYGLDSPNALTYFPRPREGSVLGAIAGCLVAHDLDHAVWEPFAESLELRTSQRIEPVLAPEDCDVLRRFGVNPVFRDRRGRASVTGFVTLGKRAGLSPEWSELHLRRTVAFILAGVTRGSRWATFGLGSEDVLARLREQLVEFLESLRRNGALRGQSAESAWFLRGPVATGATLQLDIGVALRRPGEFLSFRLRQDHAELVVRELGWQPQLALAV